MMIGKLVKRLIFFSLPILMGFFVLEYYLRSIPNDYSYKKEYLEENAENIELLVLGSSHYYRAILAEDLKINSFNAAYVSQPLNMDFLIFNSYKDRLKNLKYLMVGISYPSLFSSLETGVENWRMKNYNLYYDFYVTHKVKDYSEVLSNTFDVNKIKAIDYYWLHKNPITLTKRGSGPLNMQYDLKETGIAAAKRHSLPSLLYYKEYIKELGKIIEYCKSNDIRIILVTSPTYYTYFDNLNMEQLSLMNHLLDSLSKNNQNVYRADHLKDKKFTKEDFYDGDHLRLQGAKKFTEILNQKLDSLKIL